MTNQVVKGLAAALVLSVLAGGMAVAEEAAESQGDLKAIEIDLPEPFFGGTPLDYWSPNLEQKSFKDREPFLAPEGTEVVSRDKPVTSSAGEPLLGELSMIVDGDKDYAKSSLVELEKGVQWVQIDLEQKHEIFVVLLWHFHEGNRVYFDIVVKASNDPDFEEDVVTLYNNDHDNSAGLGVGEAKEYVEDNKGRLIDAGGVEARYVRCYSNGNTANDLNNYVEVEVWGKPAG